MIQRPLRVREKLFWLGRPAFRTAIGILCIAYGHLWGQCTTGGIGASGPIYCTGSSGNVGIDTNHPVATLDVAGYLHAYGSAAPSVATQGAYLGWNALTGTTGETDFINNQGAGLGGFAFFNTPSSGSPLSPLAVITGTGNVGIGTTTPSSQLTLGPPFVGSANSATISTNAGSLGTAPGTDLNIGSVGFRTSNETHLGVHAYRASAGSDWTTTAIGLGMDVDNTIRAGASLWLSSNGAVGIGTTNPSCGTATQACKLSVNGAIGAKEIVVTSAISADYVFKPDYRLKPLKEVAKYIQEHGHLPEIPSEKEVEESGVNLGEMQAKLLAKIEELTLHLIQADEKNRELQDRIARIESRLPVSVAGPEAPSARDRINLETVHP